MGWGSVGWVVGWGTVKLCSAVWCSVVQCGTV